MLTPWWIDEAYLSRRTPLPLYSSTALMFPKFEYSGLDGQLEIAAKIIQASLKYYIKIMKNEIPQEKHNDTLLCMNQFKKIFGTTRIPAPRKDQMVYGCDRDPQCKHIIVLRNGHIFCLPVFDATGKALSIKQLVHELKTQIVEKSEEYNLHPIGIVSSDERGVWADAYIKLKERNGDLVKMVEDSLFAICLDRKMAHIDGSSDVDVQAQQCIHGGGCHNNSSNRWFDKTVQFIVGIDGYCGMTYEHSPSEGPPAAALMDFIASEIKSDDFDHNDATGSIEPTSPIHFSIPDEKKELILDSKKNINHIASDTDVKVYTFDHFGKEFIKKLGISPDSFIQIAMQVAYYRIYGKLACTSEIATLRKFTDGRTAIIRLPNFHTAMFTVDITDPDSSEDIPASMMATMFRVSAQQHKKYTLEVMDGKGVDRYLLGLKMIAEEHGHPKPIILDTKAYQKLMAFTLSTSQIGTHNFIPIAYAPTAPDCYGICYNPQPKKLHFTICTLNSCMETSSSRFAEELENALVDMRTIILKGE
ncbi:unnamed protein product [Thelazia callipaeda]|uniref:Carn_acyltransf domain-containing protein n=1 Tax=Thelazia callipaeda TaxID=103827 RepID=A0A0N5D7L1_THECL|nr:unnamed protein product [Thelazia callipaeda]